MRLGDLDALYQRVKRSTASKAAKVLAEVLIDTAPTIDAAPVVRCRECKHWSRYKGRWENHCAGECERHNMEGGTYENDFCSYGQRKEAEDEDVQ